MVTEIKKVNEFGKANNNGFHCQAITTEFSLHFLLNSLLQILKN